MNIQLTDAQLAAATTIPKETDISTTGAYIAPAALSGQTAKLNLRVVHESSGRSLGGKSPTALFLLATPILVALDVASEGEAERVLLEAQQVERASAQGEGSAAFHRDMGACSFLDSVLRLLHDDEHLRQTTLPDGDHIVLPAPAQGKGKDPAAGGPSGVPTPATAALPAGTAAPSIPPTPAVAPAPATAAAAAAPTPATPTAAATLAQQGEAAARRETAEFLGVVRATDADTEVRCVTFGKIFSEHPPFSLRLRFGKFSAGPDKKNETLVARSLFVRLHGLPPTTHTPRRPRANDDISLTMRVPIGLRRAH